MERDSHENSSVAESKNSLIVSSDLYKSCLQRWLLRRRRSKLMDKHNRNLWKATHIKQTILQCERERDKFPVVIDSLFWFDREKENNTSETDDSPVREREKDKFLVVIDSLFWFDREKEGANFSFFLLLVFCRKTIWFQRFLLFSGFWSFW